MTMNKPTITFALPRTLLAAGTAIFLLTAAGQQSIAGDKLAFGREVDSCLAAVNNQVDLAEANRVRHVVTDSKRTISGFALTIRTSVFSENSEKRYAVRCVASGSSEPTLLRIEETDS
jgi:hypothetical protein